MDVSKDGKEIVLTFDATETTVRGTPPGISRGMEIQVMDYVTNDKGEQEGIYKISVSREELRFRRVPAESKIHE